MYFLTKLLLIKTLINKVLAGRAVGGERGIRTLDTLPYTHFPGVLLQPLGHLSRTAAMVGVLAVLIKGFKQF